MEVCYCYDSDYKQKILNIINILEQTKGVNVMCYLWFHKIEINKK